MEMARYRQTASMDLSQFWSIPTPQWVEKVTWTILNIYVAQEIQNVNGNNYELCFFVYKDQSSWLWPTRIGLPSHLTLDSYYKWKALSQKLQISGRTVQAIWMGSFISSLLSLVLFLDGVTRIPLTSLFLNKSLGSYKSKELSELCRWERKHVHD